MYKVLYLNIFDVLRFIQLLLELHALSETKGVVNLIMHFPKRLPPCVGNPDTVWIGKDEDRFEEETVDPDC